MWSIDRSNAVALVLGLAALAACSSGDGGHEAASQQMAAAEAAVPDVQAAAQEPELPEGVTQEMVERGREIYGGVGLCHACHGPDGKGMPNLGADLTDDEWVHGDGSIDGIVETIMNGVPADKSSAGTPMPPKGGSGITDEQVKDVAAYVYTLSHGSE